MDSECVKAKLSACSFGLAIGITNGLFLMLFAWAGWWFGYGLSLTDMLATIYYGYGASFMGGIVGALYGLLDGFIFGFIAGSIYNYFLSRCCKSAGKK